jgi:ABC transport system ATP-binding/permease protein
VIPQIILSGVMVKYEKLNPNFSSPVSIPAYGEIITARWGYEALAVKQFVDNKFERQYYQLEKEKSQATYIGTFLCTELKNKIEQVRNSLKNNPDKDHLAKELTMIRNEISKLEKSFPDSSYTSSGYLTPEKVTLDLLDEGRKYVDRVRKLNNNNRVPYFEGKITVVEDRLKSAGSDEFTLFKEKYVNNKLSEFVKNSTETDRIIEYNGKFVQKMEPIFRDPEPKFIKAHFYSPTKQVFGYYVDTFVVNVIVLWIMTGLMYMALYFRLLKKLLDSGEMLMGSGKGD